MPSRGRGLPQFDNPPVIETAVGVEFTALAKWDVPYFGLFWHEIQEDYPHQQVRYVSPLPGTVPFVSFLPQAFFVRCLFLSRTETRLIQVQNDRFFYNWQKLRSDEPYPHYDRLRPSFRHEWERFRQFLVAHEIGFPEIHTCEVTYINHVEKGQGWESLADLSDILTFWCGTPTTGSPSAPEAILLDLLLPLSNEEGKLRVQAQSAIRDTDGKEVLQLSLTARGRPKSSELEDVLIWLDVGHEAIVTNFTELTSSRMHEVWKRRDKT